MKVSEIWLRELCDPAISHEELLEQITLAGLEVEETIAVSGEFSNVVIGKVVECAPHPNADKLRVTKVDVGGSELLNIVCGAPNCRKGLIVACAKVGAILPGNFEIKSAKLRGELSEGMLCSYSELGISDDHDGIIELPENAPIGENLCNYLKLNDLIIDISLTPNRGDCLSISGIARDLSALNSCAFNEVQPKKIPVSLKETFPVSILANEACPRYLTRIIRNVNIKAKTPIWMVEKLRRSGIRSIDPIVDITNFVMIELGQPLHAFDLEKLKNKIEVRFAKKGEKLVLLDGNEIILNEDNLIIADAENPLVLAGIFGGKNSGVNKNTKHILLESAFFSPNFIAGKARKFGLHTESSHRFERGVDPNLQEKAIERATELLIDICGGEIAPINENVSETFLPKQTKIELKTSKISDLLGIQIDKNRIEKILKSLGCIVNKTDFGFSVLSPSFRFDLQIPEDLIEEIARIFGYNNIPVKPLCNELKMYSKNETVLSLDRVKDLLVANGFHEIITYSFVDPKLQKQISDIKNAFVLSNSISSEMSEMRLSLWPGLLNAVLYNQNRQQNRLRFFESGLRFLPDPNHEFGINQQMMISGILFGNVNEENWKIKKQPTDFFDLKGILESIFELTNEINKFEFKRTNIKSLHPGQSAEIFYCNESIGFIGVLHPSLEKLLGFNQKVLLFELIWDKINRTKLPVAKNLSKFPSNRRDIAIVVENDIMAKDILDKCREMLKDRLQDINLFDVYKGDNVEGTKKSLAISLVFQDDTQTLEDEEINRMIELCLFELNNCFHATLRE